MRHAFAGMFRWANKLIAFFTFALKIIFTLIAVLVSVIIPKLLMHPAVVPLGGFLSAIFWFWSALVPIPQGIFFITAPITGGDVPNLTVLAAQLAWQSQLNKYAAVCAGITALSVSMRSGLPEALKWVQDKWQRAGRRR